MGIHMWFVLVASIVVVVVADPELAEAKAQTAMTVVATLREAAGKAKDGCLISCWLDYTPLDASAPNIFSINLSTFFTCTSSKNTSVCFHRIEFSYLHGTVSSLGGIYCFFLLLFPSVLQLAF